jgi:hypothetical protein
MKNLRASTYVFIAAGVLAGVILVKTMLHYAQSGRPNDTRIEERLRNLAEVRATNDFILNEYTWQNQAKGIVRVPIERAKELTLLEWRNPASGRSNLLARAAKAFAPLPKPIEQPNPYE